MTKAKVSIVDRVLDLLGPARAAKDEEVIQAALLLCVTALRDLSPAQRDARLEKIKAILRQPALRNAAA